MIKQQTQQSQKKVGKLTPKDVAAIKASTIEQEFGKTGQVVWSNDPTQMSKYQLLPNKSLCADLYNMMAIGNPSLINCTI